MTVDCFRIYPRSHNSLYFTVMIFPTRLEMMAHCRTLYGVTRVSEAVTVSLPIDHMPRKEMGCICFYLGGLRIGIIAHECVHAALFWGSRITGLNKLGLDWLTCTTDEEFLPSAAGNLAGQISDVVLKLKALR